MQGCEKAPAKDGAKQLAERLETTNANEAREEYAPREPDEKREPKATRKPARVKPNRRKGNT